MTDNAPEIRRMNVRAVRASIDFFKYLTVRGGRLIRNGNRYTLEVGGGAAGRWSGRVFWGGKLVMSDGLQQFALNPNTHVGVNLRTGDASIVFHDEEDEGDLAENEFFSIATKTPADPAIPGSVDTYALNSHTCGDIHARIT